MHEHLFISNQLAVHVERLQALCDLGFETIVLHNVGRSQIDFIDIFARWVLPYFRRAVVSDSIA